MNELRNLKDEDIIWLISFFVIILAIIANKFQKEYYFTNNILKRNMSRNITTWILIIAFFIYLYFVIITYQDLNNLKNNATKEETKLAFERFIVAILFIIAGSYAIYVNQNALKNNLNNNII